MRYSETEEEIKSLVILGYSRDMVGKWNERAASDTSGVTACFTATSATNCQTNIREMSLKPWNLGEKPLWLCSPAPAGSCPESPRWVPSAWPRFLSGPALSPPKQMFLSGPEFDVWSKCSVMFGFHPRRGCQRCRLAIVFCQEIKMSMMISHLKGACCKDVKLNKGRNKIFTIFFVVYYVLTLKFASNFCEKMPTTMCIWKQPKWLKIDETFKCYSRRNLAKAKRVWI